MRSAEDLLRELNSADECAAIEAKRSREVGKSLLETISAFSNEPGLGGGYLLLGVEWEINLFGDKVYRAEGLVNPDKIQSDLASQCASVFNQAVRPEISLEMVEGRSILVVYVPEASTATKPIFLTATGLPRGAWRRIGSTDQRCNEEDIWALRGSDSPGESYDAAVVAGTSLEDFDPLALAEYRRLRASAHPDAEELGYSDADLLEALCAVRRVEGDSRATLAGLLLFGTRSALRRLMPSARIDYIRVVGTAWVEDPERRFQTVDVRMALLLAIRKVEAAILDDLPTGFELPEGSLQSVQEPLMPRKVLREALANALMHRSYRIHEPVQIIRFSNRIEIQNPGHSLKRADELGQPGSRQRNPLIAAAFHDLNLAETKGTGIRSMRRLLENAGLAAPEFQSDREHERFRAVLHLHHLFREEDLVWLKSLSQEPLSAEVAKVLLFVRESEAVDNMTCRDLTGLDTLQASALLRRLRDQGFLAKEGRGNRTYYVPGPALGLSARQEGDPHQFPSDPHQFPSVPHQFPADSHQSMPEAIQRRLPRPGERPRKEVVRGMILDLCRIHPFSSRELAQMLGGRDSKELVRTHLRPMLESGELVYTMKDMPNHPGQRYALPGWEEGH